MRYSRKIGGSILGPHTVYPKKGVGVYPSSIWMCVAELKYRLQRKKSFTLDNPRLASGFCQCFFLGFWLNLMIDREIFYQFLFFDFQHSSRITQRHFVNTAIVIGSTMQYGLAIF